MPLVVFESPFLNSPISEGKTTLSLDFVIDNLPFKGKSSNLEWSFVRVIIVMLFQMSLKLFLILFS